MIKINDCSNLNPAWISNYIHYKVYDEIIYPFPKFNGAAIELWEWISYFISHFIGNGVTSQISSNSTFCSTACFGLATKKSPKLMMTSSNGNIFRITGHLCGEFTGPSNSPAQRPVMRSFDVFFDLHLNKLLSKQWWGWWFETPSCPLWCHLHVNITGPLWEESTSHSVNFPTKS